MSRDTTLVAAATTVSVAHDLPPGEWLRVLVCATYPLTTWLVDADGAAALAEGRVPARHWMHITGRDCSKELDALPLRAKYFLVFENCAEAPVQVEHTIQRRAGFRSPKEH
ncbi:MAG: hypothetical protein GWN84_13725 [Gammaproteobacteria bacterium]|nr:hypothetical protein [Gammaproteobacteria bacterium]NIR83878.1 hypothetical protein [Gammaproteobacteria bacterium]NIU05188.1 hypothetical protein [Gammaproteobacteria bacterium]NIV52036.1 hypothetical protein [Gammaproteobacteria bacterium]NIX86461.1 hypothetical protein [Gammaproteobacteria bacterium]